MIDIYHFDFKEIVESNYKEKGLFARRFSFKGIFSPKNDTHDLLRSHSKLLNRDGTLHECLSKAYHFTKEDKRKYCVPRNAHST